MREVFDNQIGNFKIPDLGVKIPEIRVRLQGKNDGKTTSENRNGGPGGPNTSLKFQLLTKPVSHMSFRNVPNTLANRLAPKGVKTRSFITSEPAH